jgi:RNA polymerase sigma-70 factor (ECF subfamily)
VSLDRQDVPSGDLAVSHNPGAPQELAMEEARLRIVEAIESLPEPYQLPAALRYLEDLSYRDMAERLGLREDALRKRIHRANTMLRQKLQDLLQD